MATYGNVTIDGLLGGDMMHLGGYYGMTGYPNYGGFAGDAFIFFFTNVTSASNVVWLDTDRNKSTGYNGYDYNIVYKQDTAPVLYTGNAGEHFVATLDYAQLPWAPSTSTFVQEFALPSSVLADAPKSAFVTAVLTYAISAPVAPGVVYGNVTLDGSLAEWTQADRIDGGAANADKEVYGRVVGDAFVFALTLGPNVPSYQAIGSETRFWLNTDFDRSTGFAVPLYNISGSPVAQMGVEYNVRFDAGGKPILDAGATRTPKGGAGIYSEMVFGPLDYAYSPGQRAVEFAVPLALMPGVTGAEVHVDGPNIAQFPDFNAAGFTIGGVSPPPPPPPPPSSNVDPVITSDGGGATAAIGMAENGTAVTTLTASDANPGQTLTYAIVSGVDAERFKIAGNQLHFKEAPDFEAATDFGGNNVYDVVVQVSDGNGGIDPQAIAVTVTDATGITLTSNAASITGTNEDDALTGRSGANTLLGLSGNDSLSGGDGNDTLDGGTGADAMSGGKGNDTYIVDNAGDTVTEQSGTDKVETTLTQYALGSNVENLTFTGTGDFQGTGNALNNTITGSSGKDALSGNAGNDVLAGLGGADPLDGGAGTGDTATYAATSGSGVDVSLMTRLGHGGDAEGDTLLNIENLTGSNFDDKLEGNAGNNVLAGGAHGPGGDTVSYEHAAVGVRVNLATTSAQNTVGAGTDTLTGFENVIGSGFNDRLTGTSGNNILIGLDGNDTLTGGLGADTFVFNPGFGNDRITDFDASKDVILLANYSAAMITQQLGATVITFDANDTLDTLTLTNVNASLLNTTNLKAA